jgi:hypothetical protein
LLLQVAVAVELMLEEAVALVDIENSPHNP